MVAAFFLMPLSSALAANAAGAIGTVWLAKATPSAPGWVMIYASVGCVALIIHFA
jgi:hypothetical protein